MQHPDQVQPALKAITPLASEANRKVLMETRLLNKTIGGKTCPCLGHLVQNNPYVAFGPNDVASGIHLARESLPVDSIELSAQQFIAFLENMPLISELSAQQFMAFLENTLSPKL